MTFSVTDGICKNFCKGEFDGVMVQALKLHKGGITKHVKRNFKLDCRREGKEACEADKEKEKEKDAGSSGGGSGGDSADAGGGGGSDEAVSAIATYSSAVRTFTGI